MKKNRRPTSRTGKDAAAEARYAVTARGGGRNYGRPKDMITILTTGHGLAIKHEAFDEKGKPVVIPRETLECMYASGLLAAAADYVLSENEARWASNDAKADAREEKVPSEDIRGEIRLLLTGVINHEVGLVDLLDHNANTISAGTLAQLGLTPQDATEEGT